MSRWGMLIVMLLLVPMNTWAVDIQYALPVETDGHVTSVSDTPLGSQEGFGLATITGTASQIVWPAPPNCTGRHEWTRVTNPDTVALNGTGMALRPGLIVFKSTSPLLIGCHEVHNWGALRALVRSALIASVEDVVVVEALNDHEGWYSARCGDAPTNQNCIDWKANLNIMRTMYPGRGQGITASAAGATLVTDAINFRAEQVKLGKPGW